jgi:hypothetical protein
MAARKALDRQRGSLPEIRAEGTSVTFCLDIRDLAEAGRLIVRCDANGDVWASIAHAPSCPQSYPFTAGD